MSSISSQRAESLPFYAIVAMVFLLPLIFVPTVIDPLSFGKFFIFYFITTLSLLAWLFVRLQNETISIPKSVLLLSFGGLVATSFISALFSSSRAVSFVGSGMEVGTFAFTLCLFVLMFLVSILFQSKKNVLMVYFSLLASSVLVFVYQLSHVVFKINVPGLDFLRSPVANLIGGWDDFGIFFGLIGLVSVALFELVKLEKKIRFFIFLMALISLLVLVAVNLPTLWFIFGFFTLMTMVYLFSVPPSQENDEHGKKKIFRLSLVVVLLVVFLMMGNNLVRGVVNYLDTNSLDVRPSWSATFQVTQKTFGEGIKNVLLGSGPETFVYDWIKFKPSFVNTTVFWNTNFSSGVGHFLSSAASTGLLGFVATLTFLACLVYCGTKVLACSKNDLTRGLIVATYLGALYLWTFVVFYSPGPTIFIMAAVMTGMFLGLLVKVEKIKSIDMLFLVNQKARFAYVLVIVLLILGSVYSFSALSQKALAYQIFSSGVRLFNSSGDLSKTETKLNQAIGLDPQDRYLRMISEFYLIKMNDIVSRTDVAKEKQSVDFQKALGDSIDSAKMAISLNKVDPANWAQMGRVYESLASIKIAGAYEPAVGAFGEAMRLSPQDPTMPLAMARLELINGKTEEAKKQIHVSLNIKGDFVQALYLASQIEVQQGNLKGAISRSEQIVSIAPNDVGALFQLGLLYYQDKNYDGATLVLERAVALNQYYSNARYFLGLVYEAKGLRSQATAQFKKISELNPDNQEVKTIIGNLESGRSALDTVSPPAPAPEKRNAPPIDEGSGKDKLNG